MAQAEHSEPPAALAPIAPPFPSVFGALEVEPCHSRASPPPPDAISFNIPDLFCGGSLLVAVALMADVLALVFEIYFEVPSCRWSIVIMLTTAIIVFIFSAMAARAWPLWPCWSGGKLSDLGNGCTKLMTIILLTAFAMDSLVHANGCWVPRAIPAELLDQTVAVRTLGSCEGQAQVRSRMACMEAWAALTHDVSSVQRINTWRAPGGCLISDKGGSTGAVFFNTADQSRHSGKPIQGQPDALGECTNLHWSCYCTDCLCPDSHPVLNERGVCGSCSHDSYRCDVDSAPSADLPEDISSFARVCFKQSGNVPVEAFLRGHACGGATQRAISVVHLVFGLVALLGLTLPYISPQRHPLRNDPASVLDGNMTLHWMLEWIDIILLVIHVGMLNPDAEVFTFGMQIGHATYAVLLVQVVLWVFPMHLLYYLFSQGNVDPRLVLRWYAFTDLLTDVPMAIIFSTTMEQRTFFGTLCFVIRVIMLLKSVFFNTYYYDLVDCGCFERVAACKSS